MALFFLKNNHTTQIFLSDQTWILKKTIEIDNHFSGLAQSKPYSIKNVNGSLVEEVSNSLEQGKIVRLGNLGSFQVSIKGDSSDTPEAIKAQNVTIASILFRPGKKLKTMLKRLVFVPKNK